MDGEEFVRRMSNGDPEVFDDLMPIMRHMTNGACTALRVFDSEVRNDVLQEVAIKVFSNWENFRGGSKLSTWLYTIARNACIDEVKRSHRMTVQSATDSDSEMNPIDLVPDHSQSSLEQRLCVMQVLAELDAEPPARKGSMRKIEVIAWWVKNSPTTEQLAEFLQTSVGAAKTRKSAILVHIRELCAKYCGHDECAFSSAS